MTGIRALREKTGSAVLPYFDRIIPQLIEYSYGSHQNFKSVFVGVHFIGCGCCRMGITFYQMLHLIYGMPQRGGILRKAQFARHSTQCSIPINEDRRLDAVFRGNDGCTGAFTSFTGFSFTTPYDTNQCSFLLRHFAL